MLTNYIDPQTGAVGLHPGRTGKDCDNHLLFTATAKILFGLDDFKTIVGRFRKAPGVFVRYPGELLPTSWDDLLGLSCADVELAREILGYAAFTDWTWNGAWLGRIPLLVPTVLAGAGVKLSLWNQLRAAVCFIQNALEPYGETSGACMCYLASNKLETQGRLISAAIAVWRYLLAKKYKGGMREVYAIYFGEEHPFAVHGPEGFDLAN